MNPNSAPELLLPTRRMGSFENEEVKRLAAIVKRSLDEIERWGNGPHRTYGSRMVSPFIVFERNAIDSVVLQAKGGGTFGAGIFDAVDLEVDRRSLAVVWACGEVANTSGTAYTLYPFVVVSSPAGVDQGNSVRQHLNNDNNYRNWSTIRRLYLEPVTIPTTYTFAWGFLQSDASNRLANVGKQRMVIGIFDAPDIGGEPDDVLWTPSAINRAAYQSQESGTDFS